MGQPPPLPPRSRTSSPEEVSNGSTDNGLTRTDTIHLTPYSGSRSPSPDRGLNHPYSSTPKAWAGMDHRSSSMQSIQPVESETGARRKLLLIYIHGFMGDETSFRSFPAHVHNLLVLSVSESHVVHTKIYPRYKSRKDISYARDDFSNWLCPHESPNTDVILLGHSLGGILAAEVSLLHSHVPNSNQLYQHCILGVIAFDTPFLGMHPSVVGTGLVSLFRPADSSAPLPTDSSALSPSDDPISDPFGLPINDPNYDPLYVNDFRRPQRTKLENAWYFWNKHCGEMTKATKAYVTSHLEFGGCMADFPGLKRRYEAMRALEDVDELTKAHDSTGRLLERVRFVNYYSASTGKIKHRGATDLETNTSVPIEMKDMSLKPDSTSYAATDLFPVSTPSPRVSVEEYQDGQVIEKGLANMDFESGESDQEELARLSPRPSSSQSVKSGLVERQEPEASPRPSSPHSTGSGQFERQELEASNLSVSVASTNDDNLPPILPVPAAPPAFDASKYTAKDVLKVAQKDHQRQWKAYEQAKKDRERSIRDREKMIKKREKIALKEQAKAEKIAKQQETLERKEKLKRSATLNHETYDDALKQDVVDAGSSGEGQVRKKQKDRKFCVLPPKDRDGMRDPAWIRVYMEGMDEVAAHTSLFFVSETYAKLVGDTAARIESWVNEDASKKAALMEE